MASPVVLVLADDLIWSTRLASQLRAAGAEPYSIRDAARIGGVPAGARRAIVDLTARAYDGVAAVAAARAAGLRVLAVGQHDDLARRKAALAAGADRVFAYQKLFEDGPAMLARWLAGDLDGGEAQPGRDGQSEDEHG